MKKKNKSFNYNTIKPLTTNTIGYSFDFNLWFDGQCLYYIERKVYCKNCKFHKDFSWLFLPYIMGHQPSKYPIDGCLVGMKSHLNALGEKVIDSISDCFEKNKGLNCQDYKRIWWKFWVK
jgi:hypothetical protein